jgi:hypothetical protein
LPTLTELAGRAHASGSIHGRRPQKGHGRRRQRGRRRREARARWVERNPPPSLWPLQTFVLSGRVSSSIGWTFRGFCISGGTWLGAWVWAVCHVRVWGFSGDAARCGDLVVGIWGCWLVEWEPFSSLCFVNSARFFFVCCQFCSIQVRHVAYLLHFGLESFRIGSSVWITWDYNFLVVGLLCPLPTQ